MIRLLVYAAIIVIVCKLALGKYPWDYLLPPPGRMQTREKARKLLGLRHQATRDEILEAHRRLIALVHPDRGGTNDQVHEANAARDILLETLPDGY